MKKMMGILLLIMFTGWWILPEETTQNTVLRNEEMVIQEDLSVEEEVEQGLSQEMKAELLRQQQQLYAFSSLSVTEQNLYVEILYALTTYIEELELSTTDTEMVDHVFQCVMLDHPEIFYADGYSFVKYTLGEVVKKITFSGTYTLTQEEKENREAVIAQKMQGILAGIPAEASDYEKVKYIYEWIIKHTKYDREAEDNQNICSVFLQGKSVCQGYAKSAQILLQQLGIPTTLVTGIVDNGESHAWNMVYVDNEPYYLDTTWGDASYLFQGESEAAPRKLPEINYDYLCITTDELERTHHIDHITTLPECQSMENNYYVKEDALFGEMNREQLKRLIDRYYEEGRETVTLKCENEVIYQEIMDTLLGKQEIFSYLNGDTDSILYTDSSGQLSITFWL